MKRYIPFLLTIIMIAAISCKEKAPEKVSVNPGFSTYKAESSGTEAPAEKMETHYGLLTPVEVCVIFNRLGIPDTPNKQVGRNNRS